ncbi:MAG: class II glutamine amidotransferase [Longimicrobiales bacterium]|nr:class II glutamine amidotransferase [Longimicrobiales bacterium]
MCRFTLYLGPPVRLSTLLTDPEHSLIRQSYHSEERSEPLNGDGFGIGWYSPRLWSEPAVFHQITPAWSNRSLQSIAKVVASPCIMAHVRAATLGSDVNLANCHPFGYGGYLLMHNGQVGSFRSIRRRLLETLTDEAFNILKGSTDTEHLFALFVDEIIRNGCPVDPGSADVTDGGGALELARRLSGAIARVLALVAEHGDGESSFLNVAVADGRHVAVCRFDTDPDESPESLYLLHGEMYEPAGRRFPERRKEDEGEAMVVSSERLTGDPRWQVVAPASMVVLDRHAAPRILPMGAGGRLVES